MPLEVSVVTPEREVWSGEATFVSARAEGGEIGVLPGHAPFLGTLGDALLKISHEGGPTRMAVHGGFLEVFENRVTVLTPMSELASEIDVSRARADSERLRAQLEAGEAEDAEAARQQLLRVEARLRVAASEGAYD